MDLLQAMPKTENDLKCPHGVQFYDVAEGAARSRARRGPTRRRSRRGPRSIIGSASGRTSKSSEGAWPSSVH